MNPRVEGRLRGHVVAILARAGIPDHSRSDLEEELFGHLADRYQQHLADGLAERDAAERAIADFGTAASLGAELGRTYHSRLWASTVGVLLPAIAPTTSRPAAIGWLRLILGLTSVLTVIALASVVTMTPLRAIGSGIALLAGLTGLVLAFQALGRAQRWAPWYAIGVALILLVEGIGQMVVPERPGTITVPLGSILAAGVLMAVLNRWQDLLAFVASSSHLSRTLGVVLAIALLAPSIVPRALAALPDPSQATAADLELVLSMSCDRGDVTIPEGPTRVNVKRAILVVDATWSNTDLLPHGLAGVIRQPDDADTSGIRVIDPLTPPGIYWEWSGEPTVVDTSTGASAGWWGSTSPSIGLIPWDTVGTFTIAIDRRAIQPGHTIRMSWRLNQAADDEVPWPRVEVAYAHLDRFLLLGTVGCGELAQGGTANPAPVR